MAQRQRGTRDQQSWSLVFAKILKSSLLHPSRITEGRTSELCFTHSHWPAKRKHKLDVLELRQIGAVHGDEMLRYLDKRLKPQSLTQASFFELQSLFLVVFNTTLAVTYTIPSPTQSKIQEEVSYHPRILS